MRAFTLIGSIVLAAVTAPVLRAQDEAPTSPFRPFDRAAFEKAATNAGADDARLQAFRAEIEELGLGIAADNLMRDVHPALGKAVDLSEDADPRAALELTKVLAETKEPVLQGFARYHLARVFLDGDDPEQAVKVLDEFIKENAGHTPLDAEAVYFYASALAEVPEPQSAIDIFNAYLQWFPDAPERFRATAHQRMQELIDQVNDQMGLHQLADGMKWAERRIRKTDTGEKVQEKQQEFIELLEKLIEQMEEQEKQSSGPPSGNQQSSAPANKSALPGGEHRVGSLDDPEKKLAERWGDMKDRDRKAIEAEIQNLLPPSHQKMLEEYYKKLGKGRK